MFFKRFILLLFLSVINFSYAIVFPSVSQDSIVKQGGFPVIGKAGEELFSIYHKSGDLSAAERAKIISERIKKIDANSFSKDSLNILTDKENLEIVYGNQTLLNITDLDTLETQKSKKELAHFYTDIISANLDISESKYIPKNIFLKVFYAR